METYLTIPETIFWCVVIAVLVWAGGKWLEYSYRRFMEKYDREHHIRH